MNTLDDRGRVVRISGRVPWRAYASAAVRGEDIGPNTTDEARANAAIVPVLIDAGVALALYLPLAIMLIFWWPMSSPMWLAFAKALVIGGLPGVLGIWVIRRNNRRVSTRAAILADMCAACTHPLTGLPEESDGCVVCTECGAAWRTPHHDGLSSKSSS